MSERKSLFLSVLWSGLLTALGARGSLDTRLTNKSNAGQNAILILPVYFLLIIYILLEVFAAHPQIINATIPRFSTDMGL